MGWLVVTVMLRGNRYLSIMIRVIVPIWVDLGFPSGLVTVVDLAQILLCP